MSSYDQRTIDGLLDHILKIQQQPMRWLTGDMDGHFGQWPQDGPSADLEGQGRQDHEEAAKTRQRSREGRKRRFLIGLGAIAVAVVLLAASVAITAWAVLGGVRR